MQGSTVYVAGAGPVGLCAAASAYYLGAAMVVVGDTNPTRLANAEKLGCATIDLGQDMKAASLKENLKAIVGGTGEVDCAIDCVGYECHGEGKACGEEIPNQVLHDVMDVTKHGGGIGVPGAYFSRQFYKPDAQAKFSM